MPKNDLDYAKTLKYLVVIKPKIVAAGKARRNYFWFYEISTAIEALSSTDKFMKAPLRGAFINLSGA
ncbi:hypothetical protein HCU40_08665 [Pseudanabaena biceps]|nr:hypothetical protein [Pseudanabaena biceps]